MTVASSIHSVIAQGNGSTFTHSFSGMAVFAKTELLVIHVDADNVVTTLTEGTGSTNYAVTFNTPLVEGKADGFLTYPANEIIAMPTGEYLVIVRIPDLLQGTAIKNLGVLLPATMETVLDKMQHQILLMQEQLDRAAKVDREWDTSGIDFGLPAPRAGYTWRWNATADGFEEVALVASGGTVKDDFTELGDTPANYTGHAGKAATVNSGETALEFTTLTANLLHVREEQTSGTNGGSTVATTWTARVLNTVKTNEITSASLSSNQITLPAGTYEVWATAPFHKPNACKMRLRDTTGAATLIAGSSIYADASDNSPCEPKVVGRFTLGAASVLELQYYAGAVKATDGLGIAVTSGEVEVYAEVMIREVT
jgi:hypothetical protein